ncbi:MAG: 2-amino-4-hydroxy-6-hydroxymethyldihydropteridine diphosphokinase [Clostridiales bacterium]|nr:2-amino-4-hydroxy-6-hydroxymethyldihydropteridine diphosphokinase [Clostridiales bacterium]
MDKVKIRNLEVYCNHGVFKEENVLGQKFLVSVNLYTDTRQAGQLDDLTKSIHYGDVCHFITKNMKENTYMLIEAAAEHLAEKLLLEYENLKKIDLEIKKPWAPIGLPLESVSVDITRGRHMAYIGIGSNLGDKESYLNFAVESLKNHSRCKVLKVSDYINTAPVGGVPQDDFLNGCIELSTFLTANELLEALQSIEMEAKRERVIHWGPRTLDLDLLFYDDIILDSKVLTIPHPELHKRGFVLEPLAQLNPYLRHPILNKSIKELLETIQTRLD